MTLSKNFRTSSLLSLHHKTALIVMTSLLFSTSLIAVTPAATAATKTITACVNLKTGVMRLSTGNCVKGKEVKVGKVVMPAEVAPTPTSDSTLTCAQGGTCVVGNTGPGGGIVFYVQSPTPVAPWKYMEVAPSSWGGRVADPGVVWCSDQRSFVKDFATGSNATVNTDTAIGSGFTNTKMMLGTCTYGAANVATSYHGGGYSDWYLPSKDELNQLCKYVRGLPWTSNATVCAGGTGPITLGFSTFPYWSSSEDGTQQAWVHAFGLGQGSSFKSDGTFTHVRPVRAF